MCECISGLCLFKSAPPWQHALGFMHKHELAFQLSPHITNLNLNEPPLQIHQQAMTLRTAPHPSLPPVSPPPSPTPYSTPSDTYTPAGNNFTPSLSAPEPPPPPPPSSPHTLVPPFLPQPHQLHGAHLIKGGGGWSAVGGREKWRRVRGGSLYQDDFLR